MYAYPETVADWLRASKPQSCEFEIPSQQFPIFPRCVELGPTDPCAKCAFIIAPSTLRQRQAILAICAYSAKPAFQSVSKKPTASHSRKRLWTALALPNRSLGNAFHGIPVRSTYTMISNACRAGIAGRPVPGLRRYLFFAATARGRISGSTGSQNAPSPARTQPVSPPPLSGAARRAASRESCLN